MSLYLGGCLHAGGLQACRASATLRVVGYIYLTINCRRVSLRATLKRYYTVDVAQTQPMALLRNINRSDAARVRSEEFVDVCDLRNVVARGWSQLSLDRFRTLISFL